MSDPLARLWSRLTRAAVLAGAAYLGGAGYIHYVTNVAFTDRVREHYPHSVSTILREDLGALAVLVVMTALVGSFFSERYRLGGLGKPREIWAQLGWKIGLLGLLMSLISYLGFGLAISNLVPGYYPTELRWACVVVLKGVFFDEVVARYGMMTIAQGVVRRTWIANGVQAVFFTSLVFKSLPFYGLDVGFTPYFVAGLMTGLGSHLVFGWFYARHGLLSAMALHFVVDLRFIAHALFY